jgi:heterodisulfide reductase subunit A
MKFAHYLHEKASGCAVTEFYQDLSIPGRMTQHFYEDTKTGGTEFIRTESTELSKSNGKVKIIYTGEDRTKKEKTVEMVVLMPAIVPASDAAELAEILNIQLGEKGFFTEEHEIINPVSTAIQGIYIAGCATGPRGIPETVSQSEAVAGKILSTLIPGRKIETEAKTSKIFEDLCTGCQNCLSVCCYSAISYDEIKGICVVNEVLCKGCGNCAAACPSGAASHQHFTSRQIFEEMVEILR